MQDWKCMQNTVFRTKEKIRMRKGKKILVRAKIYWLLVRKREKQQTWCVFPIHCWPLLNSHVLGNELVEEERCLTVKSTFPIIPNTSVRHMSILIWSISVDLKCSLNCGFSKMNKQILRIMNYLICITHLHERALWAWNTETRTNVKGLEFYLIMIY